MALVTKNDVTQIFAIQAPEVDLPPTFANYPRGWDTARSNNGKPTIKQFNYIQQRTDQNVLWIHQNGAALPYDAAMEYAEGAVVVKDGELQKKQGASWVSTISKSLVRSYLTLDLANEDIANIATDVQVQTGDQGLWYKATAGAASLTKSPFDPLLQAKDAIPQNLLFDPFNETVSFDKKDTLQSFKNAEFTSILTNSVNARLGKPTLQGIGSARVARYFDIKRLGVDVGDIIYVRVRSYFDGIDATSRVGITLYDSSGNSISNQSKIPVNGVNDIISNAITITSSGAYISITLPSATNKELLSCSISTLANPKFVYGAIPASLSRSILIIDEHSVAISQNTSAITSNTTKLASAITGIPTKNLFNINSIGVAIGYYVSATSGELVASANYNTTDFIEISGNLNYSVSNKYTVSFYDSNKTRISGSSATDTAKTLLSPSNASYLRASVHYGQWSVFQVEQADAPTAYEPYHETYLKKGTIQPKSITSVELGSKAVEMSNANFFTPTKNLFNKNTVTIGKLVDANTGGLVTNETYDTSDFIDVIPSTAYFGSGATQIMRTVCFYNENKVSLASGITLAASTFITPADCKYVRFGLWHSNLETFQLELGAEKTSFIDYGYVLKSSDNIPIYTENSDRVSAWNDKKWAALGDSITANANWQGYVTKALGLIHFNFGIGGTRISGADGDTNAMCQDARINAIPVDIDLITVMGGTNDWAQNIVLGDINSTDPTTFYGALNLLAQKAYTRWTTKRIAIATTPYGEIPDWTGRAGWTSPAHNSLGLTTNDYADAIRQFCKRKNLHCIDVALSAGWGTYNITQALGSETDHLHPRADSNAAKGIGAAYIKGLKDIEPIA